MGVRRVVLARIDRWVERERGQDGRARKERREEGEREGGGKGEREERGRRRGKSVEGRGREGGGWVTSADLSQ